MISLYFGWFGVSLYLVAHLYLVVGWRYSHSLYLVANLVAAFGVIWHSASIASWQPVISNGLWGTVSLFTLLGWQTGRNMPSISKTQFRFAIAISVIGLALWLWMSGGALNVLGWIGVLIYLSSYTLFIFTVIARHHYLVCCVVAGLALSPILWINQDMPAFSLQLLWVLISLAGLWRPAAKS